MTDRVTTIVNHILAGTSLLLHGPGGSGKSYCIKQLQSDPRLAHLNFAITSTTGKSALDINGKTIHSWSGIGIGKKSARELCNKMKSFVRRQWKKTDVLVIDEVSMLGKKIFELLDQLGGMVRMDPFQLFGGLTVIFTGDFYQLPPINDKYLFSSDVWKHYSPVIIKFDTLYRFDDPTFADLLLRVRKGTHTEEDNKILASRVIPTEPEGAIRPTILHATRFNVNRYNTNELNKIDEPDHNYTARDAGHPMACKIAFDRDVPKSIRLRKGAQIMITRNMPDKNLVNGSRGVVVECGDDYVIGEFVGIENQIKIVPYCYTIEEQDGTVICSRNQLPVILAYALTIHKSQGATLDCVRTSIGESIFSPNMAYVALSRCRNLSGLYLDVYDPAYVYPDATVVEYDNGNM